MKKQPHYTRGQKRTRCKDTNYYKRIFYWKKRRIKDRNCRFLHSFIIHQFCWKVLLFSQTNGKKCDHVFLVRLKFPRKSSNLAWKWINTKNWCHVKRYRMDPKTKRTRTKMIIIRMTATQTLRTASQNGKWNKKKPTRKQNNEPNVRIKKGRKRSKKNTNFYNNNRIDNKIPNSTKSRKNISTNILWREAEKEKKPIGWNQTMGCCRFFFFTIIMFRFKR